MTLQGKNILVTGSAVRIGRALAIAVARHGANPIIHYHSSITQALETQAEIESFGATAHLLQANLSDPSQVAEVIPLALAFGPLFALVNNASIFEPLTLRETSLEDWERHLAINLTAPFLLSQAFAKALEPGSAGRIVNILDWRAMRPGADHLPYAVSKAALAALTCSLAATLAPPITVNGLALGAILPPVDGSASLELITQVPAGRWAQLNEVSEALLFLLEGPAYITGEIIHVDGGRHLV